MGNKNSGLSQRVVAAVDREAVALGVNAAAVWARAGVSEANLRSLREGRSDVLVREVLAVSDELAVPLSAFIHAGETTSQDVFSDVPVMYFCAP